MGGHILMAIAITDTQRAFATILIAALLLALLITTPVAAYTVEGGTDAERSIVNEVLGAVPALDQDPARSVVIAADWTGTPAEFVGFAAGAVVIDRWSPSKATTIYAKPSGGAHSTFAEVIAHEYGHTVMALGRDHLQWIRWSDERIEEYAANWAIHYLPAYADHTAASMTADEFATWDASLTTTTTTIPTTITTIVEPPPIVVPSAPWPDLPPGAEYQAAGAWAAGTGVFLGRGNGLLDPNAPITRGEMLLVLYRMNGVE